MTSASGRKSGHGAPRTDGPGSEELSDRLQRLSVPEAERVLERAIELSAESTGRPAGPQITPAMLERVAAELDIDVAHLRRALDEERLRVDVPGPTRLDGILGPVAVTAHGSVAGSLDDIRRVVDEWMTTHEGMRKRSDHDGDVVWERDKSFGASLAHKFSGAQGSDVVRRSPRVVTSVAPGTATTQRVMVTADTGGLRPLTVSLLTVAALIGAGVTGIASMVSSGFGIGEAAGGVVTFGALAGTIVAGTRMWVNRLRQGVERVIDAVRSPHLMERSSLPFGLDRWMSVFRR